MDNTITYRYVKQNLLAERFHYNYTPYEGLGFLQGYIAQRQTLRDELEVVRHEFLAKPTTETAIAEEIRQAVLGDSEDVGSAPLRGHHQQVLPAQPGDGDFVTYTLLLDLWQSCIHGQGFSGECSQWAGFLLQRFEVTKRLYVGYTSSLKPAQQIYDTAHNYALLAALLAYQYKMEPNLKLLNTVLKLVDLLASINIFEQNQLSQLTCLVAVESELAALKSLLAKHRIAI